MRFSVPRRVLKHFYKRTTAYWDNSMLKIERMAYAKLKFKIYGSLVLATWYMYEFAVPTPDVRFDIRMFISSDFSNYVQMKGAGGLDMQDETLYRLFTFSKGRLRDSMEDNPEYRASGIGRRIQ